MSPHATRLLCSFRAHSDNMVLVGGEIGSCKPTGLLHEVLLLGAQEGRVCMMMVLQPGRWSARRFYEYGSFRGMRYGFHLSRETPLLLEITSRVIYESYGAFEASFDGTQSLEGIDCLLLSEVREEPLVVVWVLALVGPLYTTISACRFLAMIAVWEYDVFKWLAARVRLEHVGICRLRSEDVIVVPGSFLSGHAALNEGVRTDVAKGVFQC